MSVTGLDAPEVENAYRAVLAGTEPISWLILHYRSRDELGVLHYGSGDIHSLKAAVATHNESSPLYTILRLQLRQYLIRLILPGTSRLLQARTAVHFQSVADRFPSDKSPLTVNGFHELVANISSSREPAMQVEQPGVNFDEFSPPELRSIEEPMASQSESDVANILSRLKAIREGRVGSSSPDRENPYKLAHMSELTSQSDQGRGDLPFSRENLSYHHSSASGGSIKLATSERKLSNADSWQGLDDYEDGLARAWKPKLRHFARPITDDQVRKSQATTSVRQRLPSGLRIGAKKNPALSVDSITTHGASPFAKERFDRPHYRTSSISTEQPSPVPDVNLGEMTQALNAIRNTNDEMRSMKSRRSKTMPFRDVHIYKGTNVESSALPQPLTLERQRLMRVLALRNKRLGLVSRSSKEAHDANDIDSCGWHSNGDSAIGVDHYGESDSDPEALNHARLRSRPGKNSRKSPDLGRPPYWSSNKLQNSQRSDRAVTAAPIISYASRVSVSNDSATFVQTRDQQDHIYHDGGYESSSSSDALIEELQDAIVEEARRISLPSSPTIRTGSAGDGTPSPYSITSVVIRTGSSSSRDSSSGGEARTPLPTVAMVATPVAEVRAAGPIASTHRASVTQPKPVGGVLEIPIDSQNQPLAFSAPRQQKPGNRFSIISKQNAQAIASSSTPDLTNPNQLITPESRSARPLADLRLDSGSTLLDNNIRENFAIAKSASPQVVLVKGRRPLSLNMGSLTLSRPVNLPNRRSMDVGLIFGRGASDVKQAPAVGMESNVSNVSDARSTRTARIMKRLSSGFSSSSRQLLSQVHEQPLMESKAVSLLTGHDVSLPSAIGELNVQFPDSLLWKRRWVEVDSRQFLVIGATKVDERANSFPKKYPLSAFKAPLIPNHDRQEMPCSVVIDFLHGGTLQFACADKVCQAQVLNWLSNIYDYCLL